MAKRKRNTVADATEPETNGSATATATESDGKKRPRDPSLCYIVVSLNEKDEPDEVKGIRHTKGQAMKLGGILLDAKVLRRDNCAIYRAVRVGA